MKLLEINFDVNKAIDLLAQFAHQYGPGAVSAATQIVHVHAIADLIRAISALVVGVIGLGIAIYTLNEYPKLKTKYEKLKSDYFDMFGKLNFEEREAAKKAWQSTPDPGDDPMLIIKSVVGGVLGVLFSIGGLAGVCNEWVWVGVTNPQLALAHQVFEKVVGQ